MTLPSFVSRQSLPLLPTKLTLTQICVTKDHQRETKEANVLHFPDKDGERDGFRLVHPTPKRFESVTLFLRLGLPSALFRHENEAFQKRSVN